MKNMKVKAKLLVAFIIIAVMVAGVGTIGILGLNTLNVNEEKMYEMAVSVKNSTLARRNLQAQRAAYRGAALMQMINVEYESEISTMETLHSEFNELLATLDKELTLNENKARLANVTRAYNDYVNLRTQFINAVRSANSSVINDLIQRLATPINEIAQNLDAISVWGINAINDRNLADGETATLLITLMSASVGVAVGVAIFFAIYISSLISKPLGTLTNFMAKAGNDGDIALSKEDAELIESSSKVRDEIGKCISSTAKFVQRMIEIGNTLELIAGGDLTAKIEKLSDKDIMGISTQMLLENLNRMFAEIRGASTQVSNGAKQIADGAQSLAQGSTQQASAAEELSASVTEIAEKTSHNADIAKEASELSETIKRNAEKGSSQMEEMMNAVKEINEASNSIGKIIKVIDEIAFKTNILALNAAVEAAHAGQHGKGFVVVAQEVRNLAAQSTEAAKDTSELIENSIEKANLGMRIATDTSSSLKEIVEGINHSAEIVTTIAKSSNEQAVAISQVNTGIDQVAQVVQQNSATAEESAAASEEMSGQSDMLNHLISQFRLKDSAGYSSALTSAPRNSTKRKEFEKNESYSYSFSDDKY